MLQNEEPSDEKYLGRSISRVERILTILKVLQGGWFGLEELLQLHPEFSKRTLYRDLEDIREYFGSAVQTNMIGQLHFIPSGALYFQPLDLTYIEAFSLYLLCEKNHKNTLQIPYLDGITSAMQKLRCLSRDLFSDSFDGLLENTALNFPQWLLNLIPRCLLNF